MVHTSTLATADAATKTLLSLPSITTLTLPKSNKKEGTGMLSSDAATRECTACLMIELRSLPLADAPWTPRVRTRLGRCGGARALCDPRRPA